MNVGVRIIKKQKLYLLIPIGILLFYIAPILFGYSWFPSPEYPTTKLPSPIHAFSYDSYSFIHVLWPWRIIESQQFMIGEFPLWNSFQSLGLPLTSQIENELFFPPEWIELNVGVFGWNIAHIIRILLAGLGAYNLALDCTRNRYSAIGAFIAYSFSAYFLWFPSNISFVNCAAIIPWVLLYTYRQCSSNKTNNKLNIVLSGITGGLLILTGQPQITLLVIFACFIIILISIDWSRPITYRSLYLLTGYSKSLLISGLIGSIQIYELCKIILLGYSIHSPNAYAGAGTYLLNFQAAIWPFFSGQLHEPWNSDIWLKELNNEGLPIVIGACQLLLGCIGIYGSLVSYDRLNTRLKLISKTLIIFILIIVIVIGLGGLGYPIWGGPILGRINFPRYSMPILSLSIAIFVAIGINFLSRKKVIPIKTPIFISLIIITCAVVSIYSSSMFDGNNIDHIYKWKSIALGLIPFIIVFLTIIYIIVNIKYQSKFRKNLVGSLLFCVLSEPVFFIRYGFDIDNELIRLIVPILICAASILWLYGRFISAVIAGILSFIITCLLLGFSSGHLQVQYDPLKNPTPTHIEFLQMKLGENSVNGRILSSENTLSPVALGGYGIASLASFGPQQIKTTAQYIVEMLLDGPRQYTAPVMWLGMVEKGKQDGNPSWEDYFNRRQFYNLIAVKYLVDEKNGLLSKYRVDGLVKVYSDKNLEIYEDMFSLPRVFGIENFELISNQDEAFKKMLTKDFSINNIAYIECIDCNKDELQNLNRGRDIIGKPNKSRDIKITKFTQTQIEISTNLDHDQLIVISDAYFPGWHARIDGKRTKILRVNGAIRGIFAPKDTKKISIKYSPYDIYIISTISFVSFIIALLFILIATKRSIHISQKK